MAIENVMMATAWHQGVAYGARAVLKVRVSDEDVAAAVEMMLAVGASEDGRREMVDLDEAPLWLAAAGLPAATSIALVVEALGVVDQEWAAEYRAHHDWCRCLAESIKAAGVDIEDPAAVGAAIGAAEQRLIAESN